MKNVQRALPPPLLGLLLLLLCSSCAMAARVAAGYMKYKDPTRPISARIGDLIGRMSLEEKIGQMAQLDREGLTPEIMRDYPIGSVLSGGGSVPKEEATAAEWVEMVNRFQNGSLSSRLGIPMIYGIDAVHGNNNVYKATIFPHNIGLGATRDPQLVKRIGVATALETRATGITYAFSPCIAVCRDPRWGRCYESYSEDPKVVKEMTEIILGLQGDVPQDYPKGFPYVGDKRKVAACAKHFVGDGGTTYGVDEGNTVIEWEGLLSIHMPANYPSILKGVSTVMVSYSSWNGKKMHANRALVTDFLKGTLDFKNKFIPMSRIDDAVTRILRVKFILGLFENPLADLSLAHHLGSQRFGKRSSEEITCSIEEYNGDDDEALLPLPKKATRILVAGSHAHNLGYQCGGWTITWQGHSDNNITIGTTILKAISDIVDPTTEVVYNENPDFDFTNSNDFAYAIVVVGEHPYAEYDGDNMNLTIPDPGPTTITTVCENTKCVVVLISGRPLVLEPYLPKMDALVAAWLPGSEGQGVADVLFGDYEFTGKLPRTWFKTVDQLPMNIGDSHYDPLFPFGFGLTTQQVQPIADS
nr:lysosomal beta glucosidase-like [Ipomoea batatas]